MKRNVAGTVWNLRMALGALGLALLVCPALPAQSDPNAPPLDPSLYTLHVYTNLLQIPALVLNSDAVSVFGITRDRFEIRLDSGPPFHPTAMHVEDDDSITLALLLDASGNQAELLKDFDEALAELVPRYLHPNDHVSIYAMDCVLVVSSNDVPANALVLKTGVETALQAQPLHGPGGKRCGSSDRLRDSLDQIALNIGNSPGRRVILAITNGRDGKSKVNWAAAQRFISTRGVALFAVRENDDVFADVSFGPTTPKPLTETYSSFAPDEDLFRILCETSGGILLSTTPPDLGHTLEDVLNLVRSRYILEFPRPNDHHPGLHEIDIKVAGSHDFVFHPGATVPPPDPAKLADPDTLPDAKSPATYGKRRPVTPNP
jgi:hypothetical protein